METRRRESELNGTFRATYRSDLPMRLLDAAGHAVLALTLPGHVWWAQYLPDIMLPFIFTTSFVTNKMLDNKNPLLWLHRGLHSVWLLPILVGLSCTSLRWVAVQWACHLALDSFTHDRWRKYERDSRSV